MKICRTTGDKVHLGIALKKPLEGTEIWSVPHCMRHLAHRSPDLFAHRVHAIFPAEDGVETDVTCKKCLAAVTRKKAKSV